MTILSSVLASMLAATNPCGMPPMAALVPTIETAKGQGVDEAYLLSSCDDFGPAPYHEAILIARTPSKTKGAAPTWTLRVLAYADHKVPPNPPVPWEGGRDLRIVTAELAPMLRPDCPGQTRPATVTCTGGDALAGRLTENALTTIASTPAGAPFRCPLGDTVTIRVLRAGKVSEGVLHDCAGMPTDDLFARSAKISFVQAVVNEATRIDSSLAPHVENFPASP